jgi:hypothetical protein
LCDSVPDGAPPPLPNENRRAYAGRDGYLQASLDESEQRLRHSQARLKALLLAQRDTAGVRLWRQPGGLARSLRVGKRLDADDPSIADGQER